MKKKRWIILIIVIVLAAIVGWYCYAFNKCKSYTADNYKCVWKCNLKSLIKGEYECVIIIPTISNYPWKLNEYEKTRYEECLEIQEECAEIEMKWYHDLRCELCSTPIVPKY